jgi:hypothetical protein
MPAWHEVIVGYAGAIEAIRFALRWPDKLDPDVKRKLEDALTAADPVETAEHGMDRDGHCPACDSAE